MPLMKTPNARTATKATRDFMKFPFFMANIPGRRSGADFMIRIFVASSSSADRAGFASVRRRSTSRNSSLLRLSNFLLMSLIRTSLPISDRLTEILSEN
ncbi:MAG TPA: hypothetical protein VH299_00750 [Solirubrobacterales bacterium]|nr:hypothetical protein [Solirubrobacterales bacterium]